MSVLGVAEVAESLGMTRQGVRKAIARRTLNATLISGGRRGREYAVGDNEVERYRREHRRPGHRRVRHG